MAGFLLLTLGRALPSERQLQVRIETTQVTAKTVTTNPASLMSQSQSTAPVGRQADK
jgi:hypothetical protein